MGIVELDEGVWGGKDSEEGDKAEEFIRDAIGLGGREGREESEQGNGRVGEAEWEEEETRGERNKVDSSG